MSASRFKIINKHIKNNLTRRESLERVFSITQEHFHFQILQVIAIVFGFGLRKEYKALYVAVGLKLYIYTNHILLGKVRRRKNHVW